MGSQYSCQYDPSPEPTAKAQSKPKEKKSTSKRAKTKGGFVLNGYVTPTRNIRVRLKKRGQPVKLSPDMHLRITKLINGDDGKLVKLEVEYDQSERPVTLKARTFQFLEAVEGEPDHSIEILPEEPTVQRDHSGRALSKIGWYKVLSNLDEGFSKDDIVRISNVRKTTNGAEGALIDTKDWITLYDERSEYLEYLDENRIMEYKFVEDAEDEWFLACNFPSKHDANLWEVTRIDPEGQGARRGIMKNWKVVGVDGITTKLSPNECEDILLNGQRCTIYFDTFVDRTRIPAGSFVASHAASEELMTVISSNASSAPGAVEPVIEIKPRPSFQLKHWVCGFAACSLIGLCVTVLVILEIYALTHFDRHDSCSDLPLILLIWTILIVVIFLGSIPAGCEGEMISSCSIGCTEWYAKCSWCSFLFSIWAIVNFFTLKDSCKDELKDHNNTWLAYQTFIYAQMGLGGLSVIFTLMHCCSPSEFAVHDSKDGVEMTKIDIGVTPPD